MRNQAGIQMFYLHLSSFLFYNTNKTFTAHTLTLIVICAAISCGISISVDVSDLQRMF